ncbi:MAG TPA: M28 family metallopeptidase [Gemmatimonadaceae bacterium]|nr:M28 family metallopeptidase [Gemmatimonadaceae bacterium]
MRISPVFGFVAAAVTMTMTACAGSLGSDANAPAVNTAAAAITADGILGHIKDLAADSMEGRGPGTPGETKAVAYMQSQFKALGLEPGNPDGTYLQDVGLIGYTSKPTLSFTVGKGHAVQLKWPDQFVASSRHDRPETKVENSDVVFVGYGVVAPEYGWDDYKDVDVKGKTIVLFVNDPQVKLAGDTSQFDTTLFKGKAMTYYGRWTYKYEIATLKGAAAVLIVHETPTAGYPYDVVKGSFSREQFDVLSPDAEKRVPVEGWIEYEAAEHLFKDAGLDLGKLHAAAQRKDFKPITLNAKANFTVQITSRKIQSKNIAGKITGKVKPDEYVIYTAHWDHLGRDTTLKGDQIYNGAMDNASGSSAILEIAKAFTKLGAKPDRSILFLSVTAEEKGLLGAKYYAEHPLYPLAKTVANINIDGINQWGKTSDFTVIGLGNSTLDDILTGILRKDNRTVRPDAEPEKGFYYRSDHFEFAKKGVPALDTDGGIEYIGKPADYGMKKRDEYTTRDYHAVSDEVKPDWDFSGAVQDLQTLFRVGFVVSQTPAFPEWKPGTEFKAARDAMLKK